MTSKKFGTFRLIDAALINNFDKVKELVENDRCNVNEQNDRVRIILHKSIIDDLE